MTEPPRPLRVKRPTWTSFQAQLNGELRMRGGTFVRILKMFSSDTRVFFKSNSLPCSFSKCSSIIAEPGDDVLAAFRGRCLNDSC